MAHRLSPSSLSSDLLSDVRPDHEALRMMLAGVRILEDHSATCPSAHQGCKAELSLWTELPYNSPVRTQRKLGPKVTCLLQAGTV